MGRLGFEPRTIRLKAEYSTVELATHCVFRNFTNLPLKRACLQEVIREKLLKVVLMLPNLY